MKRIIAAAAVLVLAACGDSAGEDAQASAEAAPETQAAAPAPPSTDAQPAVTDPQIAAIVVAAYDVDIRAGELARERAASPEVKAFAERMITDHTGVNKAAADLVGRLGV